MKEEKKSIFPDKYPKRYKLLKDLPTVKAGAIFTERKFDGFWVCDGSKYMFSEKDLHHQPEWFEKIWEHCGEATYFDGYLDKYDEKLKKVLRYDILVCGDSGDVIFLKNDTSGDMYYFVTTYDDPYYGYELVKYNKNIKIK